MQLTTRLKVSEFEEYLIAQENHQVSTVSLPIKKRYKRYKASSSPTVAVLNVSAPTKTVTARRLTFTPQNFHTEIEFKVNCQTYVDYMNSLPVNYNGNMFGY